VARGFVLPLRLMAVVWRDVALRRAFASVVGMQLAVAVAVSACVARDSHGRALEASLRSSVERWAASHAGTQAPPAASGESPSVASPSTASSVPAPPGVDAARRSSLTWDGRDLHFGVVSGAGAPGPTAHRSDRSRGEAERETKDEADEADDEDDDDERPPAASSGLLALLASAAAKFYATMVVVQWIIVALSRDYHDALARRLALQIGLPPEDADVAPRVRVNRPWLRKKVREKIRGIAFLAVGVPALGLAALAVGLPLDGLLALAGVRDGAASAAWATLSTAWGFYGFVIFTAAKTAHAWTEPTQPPRIVTALEQRLVPVPVVGRVVAVYARILRRVLAPIGGPTARVDDDPWVFLGLAAARLLFGQPGLSLALRPLLPVCASVCVVAPDAAQPGQVPWAPSRGAFQ
jgi:hypothetical protein